MVCIDGMKSMTCRTTFALDRETVDRLKHLSGVWHASQAEVVRRAIFLAENQVKTETNAASLLRTLHEAGHGLIREDAVAYLADVQDQRKTWRGEG
jgi:predicted transcriptional regulator